MKKNIFTFLFVVLLSGCTTASKESVAKPEAGIEATVLAKGTTSWDGQSLPAYPQGKSEVTILRIVIPVGATLPLHQHPVINAAVLLSGQLEVVTDENKTLQLNPGDALIEVVNTWHYGKNIGAVPAELIVFYAGTPGTPITVKR